MPSKPLTVWTKALPATSSTFRRDVGGIRLPSAQSPVVRYLLSAIRGRADRPVGSVPALDRRHFEGSPLPHGGTFHRRLNKG